METDGRKAAPATGSLGQEESPSRNLLRRRIVTDASCQVVDRKDYEPYGVEILPATNAAGNTHQYTGHERDERTGLDYMHYRYHAANLGRFMKPDNVPGDLTTPQSWNLYAYALGSPVNLTDPTGHMVGQAWGYKMSGSGVLQNNGLGGGLNLSGHPFDDNPKGVIDWAIIDDIIRSPGNSRVPHFELLMSRFMVSAGASSFGPHWHLGSCDPDVAAFLRKEVTALRGEVAVSVFHVNENLTAFWYAADDERIRVVDRNWSMGEAQRAAGRMPRSWTWTHLLHVHPPDNFNWKGLGAYRAHPDYGRFPVDEPFHVPEGPGPGDASACRQLLSSMGGQSPSQGVIDSLGHYWEYVP
ncbi:MAG: RHS repeat-associated core domain-containing protein [Bacillota bacterium]